MIAIILSVRWLLVNVSPVYQKKSPDLNRTFLIASMIPRWPAPAGL